MPLISQPKGHKLVQDIQAHAERQGISSKELAQTFGFASSHWNSISNGNRNIQSVGFAKLRAISIFLNASMLSVLASAELIEPIDFACTSTVATELEQAYLTMATDENFAAIACDSQTWSRASLNAKLSSVSMYECATGRRLIRRPKIYTFSEPLTIPPEMAFSQDITGAPLLYMIIDKGNSLGMTAKSIANQFCISQSYWHSLAHGTRSLHNLSKIIMLKMAAFLDVPYVSILNLAEVLIATDFVERDHPTLGEVGFNAIHMAPSTGLFAPAKDEFLSYDSSVQRMSSYYFAHHFMQRLLNEQNRELKPTRKHDDADLRSQNHA
jgi:transcriptional regulator with XRE-family HTH domain